MPTLLFQKLQNLCCAFDILSLVVKKIKRHDKPLRLLRAVWAQSVTADKPKWYIWAKDEPLASRSKARPQHCLPYLLDPCAGSAGWSWSAEESGEKGFKGLRLQLASTTLAKKTRGIDGGCIGVMFCDQKAAICEEQFKRHGSSQSSNFEAVANSLRSVTSDNTRPLSRGACLEPLNLIRTAAQNGYKKDNIRYFSHRLYDSTEK